LLSYAQALLLVRVFTQETRHAITVIMTDQCGEVG